MPETIRINRIGADDRLLTVSTIKLGPNRYDTVVFDDTTGKILAGKRIGPWVIDKTNVPSTTRDEALDVHRAALLTVRDEPIRTTAA